MPSRPDVRAHPELYRVGVGEQGVLTFEPYKSELLPHWRFKTEAEAKRSAAKILGMFRRYREQRDLPGMDMARKFLQMGYTRARRYANHTGGRKYAADGGILPQRTDALTSEKAHAARLFYAAWKEAREDPDYRARRAEHRLRHG